MQDSIKTRLFYGFSIATALVFLTFGSLYIYNAKYYLGTFEASLGIFQLLNMWLNYKLGRHQLSYKLLVISVYLMSLVIFITGGFGNTGFLWIQFIPIFTMLLLEVKEAKKWAFAYSSVLFLILAYHFLIDKILIYTNVELRQSILAYLIFLYLTHSNEKYKDIARKQLQEQNKKLKELTQIDTLTKLYNRGYVNQKLNEDIYKFERYGTLFSVIMFDIDNFKKINDTFGHQMGDEVLISISKKLLSTTRESDIVGRWGGEEFLIVCPETSLSLATNLANKLKDEIASLEFSENIKITASFGVAQIQSKKTISNLLSKADKLLYEAKNCGKNMVKS